MSALHERAPQHEHQLHPSPTAPARPGGFCRPMHDIARDTLPDPGKTPKHWIRHGTNALNTQKTG